MPKANIKKIISMPKFPQAIKLDIKKYVNAYLQMFIFSPNLLTFRLSISALISDLALNSSKTRLMYIGIYFHGYAIKMIFLSFVFTVFIATFYQKCNYSR